MNYLGRRVAGRGAAMLAKCSRPRINGGDTVIFFPGLHHPNDAQHFERCMVSINALKNRKGDFPASDWMLDSGAFSQVSAHGQFLMTEVEYAESIKRWAKCGKLLAAVSQDYMCEPFVTRKTGLTVAEHQRRTIGRYVTIASYVGSAAYVLPVLQGYDPSEYVSHVRQYGRLLGHGQWVGVGSVCKRNADIEEIENVLVAIRTERPDLRLHGFGVKLTALQSQTVRDCLHSADSMAWSFAARWEGRDGNSWLEAKAFVEKIESQQPVIRDFQSVLF